MRAMLSTLLSIRIVCQSVFISFSQSSLHAADGQVREISGHGKRSDVLLDELLALAKA